MTLDFWYWLFVVLWVIIGFWVDYVPGQPYPIRFGGRNILFFILFVIIGLKTFGSPVK